MYTQCPDCQTRFRVTAGTLRAAHGTVRCGRCGGAFDALERLSDSLDAAPEPALDPLVISVAPIGLASEIRAALEEPAAEPTEVLVDETLTTETITLEGERVSVDVEAETAEPVAAPEAVEESPLLPEVIADSAPALESEEESPDKLEATEGPLAAAEDFEDASLEFELDDDLDATDRFAILEIPESQLPDDAEAERELEELVQRLQRENVPEPLAPDEAYVLEKDAAETLALLESGECEVLPDEPVFVDVSPDGAVTSVPEPWVVSVLKLNEPVPVDHEQEEFAQEQGLELEPEAGIVAIAGPTEALTGPSPYAPRRTEDEPVGPARPARMPPAAPVQVEQQSLSTHRYRPEPIETEPEPEPEHSVWRTVAWGAGSLLLAIALVAQVVHHWRDVLARDARFGEVLRATYARMGLEQPPSRDLTALELRQLGVDARDAGRMVVRASLTNRASFAQPMPILRLQLEDRYGSMLAARDFEPSEYLTSGGASSAILDPGASSEAELVLVDPGSDAVGYRLDVCLRDANGRLVCAQPPGPG